MNVVGQSLHAAGEPLWVRYQPVGHWVSLMTGPAVVYVHILVACILYMQGKSYVIYDYPLERYPSQLSSVTKVVNCYLVPISHNSCKWLPCTHQSHKW